MHRDEYEEAPRFEKIRHKSHIPDSKKREKSPVRWERKRTDWSKTRNKHNHDLR